MVIDQQPLSCIQKTIIVASFGLFALMFAAMFLHPDVGFDWFNTFAPAGRQWWDPYQVLYHNPPWIALLLWPLALLPAWLGMVTNNLLAVGVTSFFIYREAKDYRWVAILATLLSPPFYQLLFVSNIDWIIVLGLLIAGRWSLPLLAAKPQTVVLVPLYYFRQAKYHWNFWIPSLAVGLVSLLIWGFWPADIPPLLELDFLNASPFPWGIPFGLFAIWKAWKEDSLLWALIASALISPYFRFSSLVPLMAVASTRYPRLAFGLVAAFWIIAGIVVL